MLRSVIWERDKGVCQICKRKICEISPDDTKSARVILSTGHIHHKDLNWENNDPDNLVLLCRDCHAALHSQIGMKRTTAYRSRKEAKDEARIRRAKKQADKWRSNYYSQKRKKRNGKRKST